MPYVRLLFDEASDAAIDALAFAIEARCNQAGGVEFVGQPRSHALGRHPYHVTLCGGLRGRVERGQNGAPDVQYAGCSDAEVEAAMENAVAATNTAGVDRGEMVATGLYVPTNINPPERTGGSVSMKLNVLLCSSTLELAKAVCHHPQTGLAPRGNAYYSRSRRAHVTLGTVNNVSAGRTDADVFQWLVAWLCSDAFPPAVAFRGNRLQTIALEYETDLAAANPPPLPLPAGHAMVPRQHKNGQVIVLRFAEDGGGGGGGGGGGVAEGGAGCWWTLLQRRSLQMGVMPGFLGSIGGMVDPDDHDSLSCAARELVEETGLVLDAGGAGGLPQLLHKFGEGAAVDWFCLDATTAEPLQFAPNLQATPLEMEPVDAWVDFASPGVAPLQPGILRNGPAPWPEPHGHLWVKCETVTNRHFLESWHVGNGGAPMAMGGLCGQTGRIAGALALAKRD